MLLFRSDRIKSPTELNIAKRTRGGRRVQINIVHKRTRTHYLRALYVTIIHFAPLDYSIIYSDGPRTLHAICHQLQGGIFKIRKIIIIIALPMPCARAHVYFYMCTRLEYADCQVFDYFYPPKIRDTRSRRAINIIYCRAICDVTCDVTHRVRETVLAFTNRTKINVYTFENVISRCCCCCCRLRIECYVPAKRIV